MGVWGLALDRTLLESYTLLMYHLSFYFDNFFHGEAVSAFAWLTRHFILFDYRLY